MSNNYRISVVIPTYNRANLINRALDSVIKQTYENLQIIIVDNASTDSTEQVVRSINDKRIRFIRHEINKGPAASRNTGLNNSSGDFIAFLDSDDEWLPQKLEKQIKVFQSQKDTIGLVFTNGFNHAQKRDFITEKIDSGIFYDPKKDNYYPLRRLISPPSSWLLPTQVTRQIGYFEESMYTWDDGDYLARVAYRYPLYFLNEKLVIWHTSEIHLNVMNADLITGKEIFLKRNMEFLKKDKDYLFRFYRALGKDTLQFNKKKARGYLFDAFKLNPWDFSNLSKILKTL